jgi:hypothetical protein
MTFSVAQINTAADTFQVLIDRVNSLANVSSNLAVTVAASANGSLSTGNGYVNGSFGSVVLVTPTLRGGNVQAAANLTVSSNVSFGNSTANVFVGHGWVNVGSNVLIDTVKMTLGNTTVNTQINSIGISLSGNLVVNSTFFSLGNSSVNVSANSSRLSLGGSVFANQTHLGIGNVSANLSHFGIGNSTVNVAANSSAFMVLGVNVATINNRAAVNENTTSTFAAGRINFVNTGSATWAMTLDSGGNQINVSVTASGASGGNVYGPASSTTDRIAVWSGTGGNVLAVGSKTILELANVWGPSSSVNGRIAVFNGTSGNAIADGGYSISDLGNASLLVSGTIPDARLTSNALSYGVQMIPIPAISMTPRTTNGAEANTAEMTTNMNMFVTRNFSPSTQEYVQWAMPMPKSWNEGTLTYRVWWSHPSTTTNFGTVFHLQGVAISDNETGNVAFGTAQSVTDTGGTTNNLYRTPESSAITIGGSPAESDFVMFQLSRVPSDGSDTMAVDARVHAVELYLTTTAGHDG